MPSKLSMSTQSNEEAHHQLGLQPRQVHASVDPRLTTLVSSCPVKGHWCQKSSGVGRLGERWPLAVYSWVSVTELYRFKQSLKSLTWHPADLVLRLICFSLASQLKILRTTTTRHTNIWHPAIYHQWPPLTSCLILAALLDQWHWRDKTEQELGSGLRSGAWNHQYVGCIQLPRISLERYIM